MATTGVHQQRRLVRVWFGEHVIVNKTADEHYAQRFAQSMQRRFSSLRVTNDPVAAQTTPPVPPSSSPSPSASTWPKAQQHLPPADGRGSA